jgi:diguanylate cyclase (GGDEF)-like protein
MDERRANQRGRTLLGGKIVFNGGRSTIDCQVRNLSDEGACLEVVSQAGIPTQFQLALAGDREPRDCKLIWQSDRRMGVSFARLPDAPQDGDEQPEGERAQDEPSSELLRGHMLALRAALDEVRIGVVLLDHELRAQFINRAFRRMWRLPDSKAEGKPPFVALMYHGRDTRAYEVPRADLDEYIAERVEHIKRGDASPRDVRLTSGEVLRLQCAVLPNGGRMLSYTPVTDIVRHADEMEVLKAALNEVQDGVVLLDADLNARFQNRAVRHLFKVPDHQAETPTPFSLLIGNARKNGMFGVPDDKLESFIASRIALIRAGDPSAHDLRTGDGRRIRARCSVMPDGGRMLTYCDITDLVHHAEQLEKLATTDPLTGLYNRRHFLALADKEWSRFQRYQRPLSMLMVDIDHFKAVNDRFGHATGDEALKLVAETCRTGQRESDIVGRIGGEEFALLLPETDAAQARTVAARIQSSLAVQPFIVDGEPVVLTVSIGLAAATLSMSGTDALMKAADQALYSAKEQGRNRAVQFAPKVPAKLAAE